MLLQFGVQEVELAVAGQPPHMVRLSRKELHAKVLVARVVARVAWLELDLVVGRSRDVVRCVVGVWL